MARPESVTVARVDELALEDIGLGEAILVTPDGQMIRLYSLTIPPGMTILEALLARRDEGFEVYLDYDCLMRNMPVRKH